MSGPGAWTWFRGPSHNVVAFQGLHNEGKRLFIIFDEAAGIFDGIWDAADGCMTDANTQRFWFVFGNPNLPRGRFKECFPGGREAFRWTSRGVDSRDVSFTDKNEIETGLTCGAKTRTLSGTRPRSFPAHGSQQFISPELANEAARREVDVYVHDPLVIGVDVARFGDDESVIYFSKRSRWPINSSSAPTRR
jgi:hypothetical protein